MNSQEITPQVGTYLESIRKEVESAHPSVERLRVIVRNLLTFLASAEGRTDANCRAVDFGLMNDENLWERIESVEADDPALADVMRDMAGALHDTVSAPAIAKNFDSTPEQLLKRLG